MREVSRDGSRKPVILSVDDDSRILRLVEFQLRDSYTVVFAKAGSEALGMVKTVKPDVILLDVMMPNMNGYEVCESLQKDQQTSYIPVIFVTSLGEEEDKARAFAVGAVDYLVKPFQKGPLLEIIAKHVKTNTRWQAFLGKEQAAPAAAPAQGGDFAQFRAYLASQLRLSGPALEAIGALQPQNLYSKCAELGFKSGAVVQHVADFLKLPRMAQINPPEIILGALPAPFCKSYSIIPMTHPSASLALALSNPFEAAVQDLLKDLTNEGRTYRLAVIEPESISRFFRSGRLQRF